ncbi:aldehyde dehydrogenase family protein [Streptomyces sp. NBC_01317]|uniref:aldehyde dehydrogenase family protein n=1 Tax=Streptomyces sp. NBC_01317 TaxID=2903822 RepID=UPI002E14D68E|nr:aldehyde dehydrogenase family protein [Streptomyces sp. NBC_01317]
MAAFARALRVGPSLDRRTQAGPLVSERQRARVEAYGEQGATSDARLAGGGARPAGAGRRPVRRTGRVRRRRQFRPDPAHGPNVARCLTSAPVGVSHVSGGTPPATPPHTEGTGGTVARPGPGTLMSYRRRQSGRLDEAR